MSLNQSLSISLDSMKNNQLALTVVSHNIANLNTEGYAKQRVNFSEDRFTVNSKSVINQIMSMNGANIDSISNYIDSAKFKGLTSSVSDANYYNTLANDLGDLEDVANDLGDNGLNALLNNFYTASANLEQFPTDMTIRQQYVSALNDVCEKFNYVTNKYDSIQDEKYNDVEFATSNINSLLSQLADLNLAHIKNGQGASTQNEINSVLSQLSNYVDLTYDQNSNGSYNVYFANTAVVEGTEQMYEFQTEFDKTQDKPLTVSLVSLKDNTRVDDMGDSIKSGSLKAQINFLNGNSAELGFSTINDMKTAIQGAKTAFMNALNDIQTHADDTENTYAAYITTEEGELILAYQTVTVIDEETGEEVQKKVPDTPQEILSLDENNNLKVNSEIIKNPYLVAAARIDLDNYAEGEDWTKSIGNSTNAGYITALKDEKICSYGGTNNCTLSQFLINTAAKNGLDLNAMQNKADLYQGIADANAQDYASTIGVNLDEELADMIRYQRSYEASAAVFSTVNNIMQILMNLV